MRVPETDNIHYQYAFKKGYRMAIDGKKVTSMPSDIRRDMMLRQYFQEGWEQAVEDVTLAQQEMKKPDWRHRFVWFAIMILGGLATAMHLIDRAEQEKAEQQAIIDAQSASQQATSSAQLDDKTVLDTVPQMRLLSDAQHQDLKLNQQDIANKPAQPLELEAVIVSPIKIAEAVISQSVENREPVSVLSEQVPKYVRSVSFFTVIDNANGEVIYHRWRTDNEILATIELPIKSDHYRTWSSKQMASAWQGQWYVEVLDSNQNVIYRTQFKYGNQE